MLLSGYGLSGYGLSGYGLSGYRLSEYGLSGYGLSGYGLSGYGLSGFGRYRSIVGMVYRGMVAVGLIMKFPLRGIMAVKVKKLSKLGAIQGGSKRGKHTGRANADKQRGRDKEKKQGRGRKFFCIEFVPLVVPPAGTKPMQKTPPLCFLSLSLYPPLLTCIDFLPVYNPPFYFPPLYLLPNFNNFLTLPAIMSLTI